MEMSAQFSYRILVEFAFYLQPISVRYKPPPSATASRKGLSKTESQGTGINTRLIRRSGTGHRSPARSVRRAELDLKERAFLQVRPLYKVTSIISPPAVCAYSGCVAHSHRLSSH